MRATSAVSRAVSVPAAPMAMPTLARASAGASFTPSPTMATWPYARSRSSTTRTLSSGINSPWKASTPACWAMSSAMCRLSPVNITVCSIPARLSFSMVWGTPSRRWSEMER